MIWFSGNTLAPTGQQYDNKTGQWFGSLVRSSGEDGVVLVGLIIYKDKIVSQNDLFLV